MTSGSGMAACCVRFDKVEKTFRDFWGRPHVRAVRGISFTVHAGTIFGLLGPNGSGKSTAMKMMLGLLRPTAGQIAILGQPPDSVTVKARLGYMPEESALYPFLTAEELLDLFGQIFGLSADERHERVDQLLEMMGLHHARRRRVGEFSKGMMRRLCLAQALINDPELLLLDEPTAGLDPVGCRQVKDILVALAQRGRTVVLSSHLLADVEDVCDRIAILYHGVLCAEGRVNELLEEREQIRVCLPALDPSQREAVLNWLRQQTGVEPVWDHPRKDLETVFLETIRKAPLPSDGASGAAVEERRPVAPFLSRPREPLLP